MGGAIWCYLMLSHAIWCYLMTVMTVGYWRHQNIHVSVMHYLAWMINSRTILAYLSAAWSSFPPLYFIQNQISQSRTHTPQPACFPDLNLVGVHPLLSFRLIVKRFETPLNVEQTRALSEFLASSRGHLNVISIPKADHPRTIFYLDPSVCTLCYFLCWPIFSLEIGGTTKQPRLSTWLSSILNHSNHTVEFPSLTKHTSKPSRLVRSANTIYLRHIMSCLLDSKPTLRCCLFLSYSRPLSQWSMPTHRGRLTAYLVGVWV